MNRDEILNRVGAETFNQIVNEFQGMAINQIKNQLDTMFTQDENTELAQAIYDEISSAAPIPELVRMTERHERGTDWTRESYIIDFPNPECFEGYLEQTGINGVDYLVRDDGIWASMACAQQAQELYEQDNE